MKEKSKVKIRKSKVKQPIQSLITKESYKINLIHPDNPFNQINSAPW